MPPAPANTAPEIHRVDLAEVVLSLKSSGVTDVEGFSWFESPGCAALERAEVLLRDLGAIDPETSEVTELGRRMARFPVAPRYARVLLEGARHGCFDALAEVVALTQGKPLFLGRKVPEQFARPDDESDFQPLLRALHAAQRRQFRRDACDDMGLHGGAAREASRLANLLQRHGPQQDDAPLTAALLGYCLLTGFPDQVAVR